MSIRPLGVKCNMADSLPSKIFPSQLRLDDEFYMSLAYNLAVDAWRAGEVPVGAIMVLDGEVIAQARNETRERNDGTAHAEMIAMTQAARFLGDWRLNSTTLYVTKEPCPMCAGAAVVNRVGRVVYGLGDPKMGCLGGLWNMADVPSFNHRMEVTRGILEQPCRELLSSFFKQARNRD